MRGTQPAGPEWRKACDEIRRELLRVCPRDNRRFTTKPGTFRRIRVSEGSGVGLHLISRFLDQNLPVSADTAIALGQWLGLELRWVRVKATPKPTENGSDGARATAKRAAKPAKASKASRTAAKKRSARK